ncbi:3-hydroxyacyl-CoA dehydrogenase family protein [Verrucosispora sp. WMMD703]|uniref:3-hydroxyacyl-CoA dehydrogenase family protein n=1 Tax=Verrucosispora sp. WMMD703 TaxID=3403463 RepID=UPI003B963650
MSVVGVAGAGVMGIGVTQNLAQTGHQVVLVDTEQQVLDAALQKIEAQLRMSRMLGGPAVDTAAAMALISTGVDPKALAEVDFVIENIPERWDLKRALYLEMDRICDPATVFVVNTSAIPITEFAAVTGRPEQLVGVHFMNPVPMKTAVELIAGEHTSAETVRRTRELLNAMGKKAIDVKDVCGFISNRVLMLTVNEAAFLVHQGVATAEAVDEVFRSCFGHPMGPLETADLIGVDTILHSIDVLYQHYRDSKYRPCPLLRTMANAGRHGRKSGRGFYEYGPTA